MWPYVSLIRSDCRNLWKESIDVLEFLHRYDHQGKVASEYYFGWVWQVIPLVRSNCWILWYISISGKNHFLHENKHQGKVVSETTIFGWIWPICTSCPVRLLDSLINIIFGRNLLMCFTWRYLSREGSTTFETITFHWVRLDVSHIQHSSPQKFSIFKNPNVFLLFNSTVKLWKSFEIGKQVWK